MALKLILKKEIILPDDYMSEEDFDEIIENSEDFEGVISFLEEDLMSVMGFTNGLSGFIKEIKWTDNEQENFYDNFTEHEDFN